MECHHHGEEVTNETEAAMVAGRNKEQRRHPRVTLSLNVNWGPTSHCQNDARITSLSLGGCFIQPSLELPVGRTVFLRLMLRTEHVLRCRVRYNLLDVGSGIEFLRLTEDDRTAIHELVDYYRPTARA